MNGKVFKVAGCWGKVDGKKATIATGDRNLVPGGFRHGKALAPDSLQLGLSTLSHSSARPGSSWSRLGHESGDREDPCGSSNGGGLSHFHFGIHSHSFPPTLQHGVLDLNRPGFWLLNEVSQINTDTSVGIHLACAPDLHPRRGSPSERVVTGNILAVAQIDVPTNPSSYALGRPSTCDSVRWDQRRKASIWRFTLSSEYPPRAGNT